MYSYENRDSIFCLLFWIEFTIKNEDNVKIENANIIQAVSEPKTKTADSDPH